MPDYPDAAPAILTDIRLTGIDLAPFQGKDLVVRTVFEPATSTCAVSVHVGDIPGGGLGHMLAYRVMFTGYVEPAQIEDESPDPRKGIRCTCTAVGSMNPADHGGECEKFGRGWETR